jgi:hypothetical protein
MMAEDRAKIRSAISSSYKSIEELEKGLKAKEEEKKEEEKGGER